jgi:monoamine oxidase
MSKETTGKKRSNKELKGIDRRRFLTGAGTVAAGVTVAAATITSASSSVSKSASSEYDVIVIGGGFAGVAAARDSMENGYKTLIVEARNRMGGRTLKTDFEGTPVELGGFWIHHSQPFVWAEKERYGLEITETPGAMPDVMMMNSEGQLNTLTLEQIEEAIEGWHKLVAPGYEVLPRAWDLLFNRDAALKADSVNVAQQIEATDLTEFQKSYLKPLAATQVHGYAETMPYLELLRWNQCGGGSFTNLMDSVGRYYLEDGSDKLLNMMIEDGGPDIRLSAPIKAIEDKGSHVEVTTVRGEKLTASVVISTLPMNVLPSVSFIPPLPATVIDRGNERHAGSGFKMYAKVKGDVGNLLSVGTSTALTYVATCKQTRDYTILVGFGHDPQLLDMYDDDAVQAALRELVPDVQLLSTIAYDWNNDPYAKGTWCTYRQGWASKDYDAFSSESGRIFFASGDHGEGWRGFIDGAIGSGIRAAQRVNKLLGG